MTLLIGFQQVLHLKKKDDMKTRIGFDFHGVLDTDPVFIKIIKALIIYNEFIENIFEIHIITGMSQTLKNEEKLRRLFGIDQKVNWWHSFFSIQDFLVEFHSEEKTHIDSENVYHFPDELWNKVKSKYCEINQIDIHIDDSFEYLKHFKTNGLLYRKVK